MPIREERSTETMFYGRASKPLSQTAQASAEKLFFATERLIADGATSLFGSFCIADADLAFMLQRLILNGDPVPSKARAYAEAAWARPSVRAFVEHKRPTR
jgi:glutathione S-transferase